MSLPNELLPLLVSGGEEQYLIERSLRFNSSDSAYLSRTPASASNRKTWTWAGWVKRATLASTQMLFSAGTSTSAPGSNLLGIFFYSSDTFRVADAVGVFFETAAVYRDPSAWMHVVVAFDTTQATASDRLKCYINGVQLTNSLSSWPAQDYLTQVNNNNLHNIGREFGGIYLNGYLADIHFIDGQALDPTSFGKFDTNGVWQPIEYQGEYGTNGFHLPFSDNSTAAALGTDTSGNGNDWTVNNLEVYNGNPFWSQEITGSPTAISNPQGAFDGDAFTSAFVANPSSPYGGTITFAPAIPISITTSCEFAVNDYFSTTGGAFSNATSYTVSVDGATTDVNRKVANGQYVSCPELVGKTISQSTPFVVTCVNSGTGSRPSFVDLKIDGVSLVENNGSENNDSLVDTPTNGSQTDTGVGGEVRGNYCTANPLDVNIGNGVIIANGNLDLTLANALVRGTMAIPASGKWYFEWYNDRIWTGYIGMRGGVTKLGQDSFSGIVPATGYIYGGIYKNGSGVQSIPTSASGDIFAVAIDMDNLTLQGYKNGALFGSQINLDAATYIPCFGGSGFNTGDASSGWVNFGQRPFAYTAPSGYKALCTANLPTPTIANGSKYMNILTWNGDGTDGRTISGLSFEPDFVWIKDRTATFDHRLWNSITSSTRLSSNTTSSEISTFGQFSTTSTGITVSASVNDNNTGSSLVAWNWDAGSSTVANTSGSITSQVRANPSAGFSIVSWAATGSNATIGHGLNVIPYFIICKNRDASTNWAVYHHFIGATNYLLLNSTAVSTASSTYWQNTPATTSVFYTGTANDVAYNNMIAYCFAPVSGYSSFGVYTGNGSADGPFVYTGFRPRWVMIKSSSVGGVAGYDWIIHDTSRSTYNLSATQLVANSSVAENLDSGGASVAGLGWDILSNGFKLRTTSLGRNGSGSTYIYAAFSENPFKLARAR